MYVVKLISERHFNLVNVSSIPGCYTLWISIQILFSLLFSCYFNIFLQLLKIITNRKMFHLESNFFPHACVDVYCFLMLISWFLCFWIFNGDLLIAHDAKMICCIPLLVKCSWFIQLTRNLVCLILSHDVIFELWFGIFIIWYHCFGHMNIWCDNLCHNIWCCLYAFSFICHLISSGLDFWYDVCS